MRFYERRYGPSCLLCNEKLKHFMSLIQGIALLNAPFRMSDDADMVNKM